MKIIGYTVGTPLPKPNLKQTDPTKGDYVKGKEILDEKYIKVDEQELTDEQKAQVRTNVDAVSMTEAEALTDSVAFIDVEDNENVDVPDSDVSNIVVDSALSTSSTNPVQNKVITEKINEITSDIETLNNSIENLPTGETVQSDWNQSDSNAPDHIKNRPFGEETVETNIEGMTFGTFPHADPYAGSTSAVAHGLNIPFAPGQVWTVTYKIGSNGAESTLQNFEVQQYDDGTLYIGDYPVADGGELYITSSDVCYNESWARMIAPYDIKLVGVSGSVTETALKKIDPKFIPEWNELNGIPFGEETEMVTYLEPYTFDASSNAGWVQLPFTNTEKVVVGTVLTVLWDGKTYECVASSDEGISREFGNAKLRYSNGNDTGEPFHITINSPTYYVCVAETGTHTVSVVGYEAVVKKIDPKYLPEWNDIENAPFGEKTVETNIEGMTIGDFPVASSGEESHNLNVPLALGQKWSVYKNNGSLEGTFEVQEDEDGRLFICGSPVKITADTIECNAQWVRMLSVQRIYIVGVSGTTVETTVKKIDQKYLPGAMIVKLTFDSDGTTLLADKTYAEVKAAIDAGVVVRMLDTDGMSYLDVSFVSGMIVQFSRIDTSMVSGSVYRIIHRLINLYSYTTDITESTLAYDVTPVTSITQ